MTSEETSKVSPRLKLGIAAVALFATLWAFSFDEAEAAIPKGEVLNLHLPAVPPIESIPLTAQGVDAQLALIQKAQDAVQAYHDKFAYLVSPNDPDLEKLKKAVAFYDAQHDRLLALRPDIVQQEYASAQSEYSDYHKRIRAGRIREDLALIAHTKESQGVAASLHAVDSFVDKAQAGTILFTDTEGRFGPKGGRFWYPLEGVRDPENPKAYKLPPLLEFKYAGASKLPLSTSRALYELQLTLKDRMTLETPLGEVVDAKSKPYVTAGAFDTYSKHVPRGGHADLSGIDFRAIDTSPAGVADVLADAKHTRNGHLWFEIPGSKENSADLAKLSAFREQGAQELIKHGYSREAALQFIKEHTRLVPGANAMHYHFDTEPRPPILAPNTLIARR